MGVRRTEHSACLCSGMSESNAFRIQLKLKSNKFYIHFCSHIAGDGDHQIGFTYCEASDEVSSMLAQMLFRNGNKIAFNHILAYKWLQKLLLKLNLSARFACIFHLRHMRQWQRRSACVSNIRWRAAVQWRQFISILRCRLSDDIPAKSISSVRTKSLLIIRNKLEIHYAPHLTPLRHRRTYIQTGQRPAISLSTKSVNIY